MQYSDLRGLRRRVAQRGSQPRGAKVLAPPLPLPGVQNRKHGGCEKVLPHNGAGQGGILPHLSHPMQCNSSIKLKPVLNGIWHNACPYDLQCIIRSIIGHRSLKDARISVLPKTFNTYRSATISLGNGRQIKFVNSFQFVASPLDEI